MQALEGLLAAARSGELRGLLAVGHLGGPEYYYAGGGSLCSDAAAGRAAAERLAKKLLQPQRDVV